jgi:hypothetical protein
LSDGKTHYLYWKKFRILSLVTAILATILYWWFFDNILNTFIIFISIILGFQIGQILTPDMDQVQIGSEESKMMNKLGIFGVIYTMYFLPYAYFMRFIGFKRKGHRSAFSHLPGFSTAFRMIWILLIPICLMIYYNYPLTDWMACGIIGTWLGISESDFLHYILDKFSTKKKG